MYKCFIALFFVQVGIVSFGAGVPELRYNLVSDTVDVSVPEGKCLVYGNVRHFENPFPSCKVASENHEFSDVSNAKGEYQLLIDADSIRVYAFQIGFDEIVTNAYNFKSGHRVHIDFFMKENIQVEMNLKPVIYAYNSKLIEATLRMNLTGGLTFSYPKYQDGWDVIVKENGLSILGEESRTYPYLFWEGETPGLDFQSSGDSFVGYCIRTDSTIQFLETKSEAFGFNQNETTDFITFWAPRIQQHKYAKIEFLVDEKYDVIGGLKVTPTPDNMRRVYILFQGSEAYISETLTSPQEIKPISRNGFTIVEWGGTELSPSKKMNP